MPDRTVPTILPAYHLESNLKLKLHAAMHRAEIQENTHQNLATHRISFEIVDPLYQ